MNEKSKIYGLLGLMLIGGVLLSGAFVSADEGTAVDSGIDGGIEPVCDGTGPHGQGLNGTGVCDGEGPHGNGGNGGNGGYMGTNAMGDRPMDGTGHMYKGSRGSGEGMHLRDGSCLNQG